MNYEELKQCVARCPSLAGLDEAAASTLLWRGQEQTLEEGAIIYPEGAQLDGTFGLVLAGDLIVEKGGEMIGGIFEQEVFGEMAYFTSEKRRTATLRVCSPRAVLLKFQLTPEELNSPQLARLRECLGRQTWERFVSSSQNTPPGPKPAPAGTSEDAEAWSWAGGE